MSQSRLGESHKPVREKGQDALDLAILARLAAMEPQVRRPFPCLKPGTSTYWGCIGTDTCRARGLVSACIFGRWASSRPRKEIP